MLQHLSGKRFVLPTSIKLGVVLVLTLVLLAAFIAPMHLSLAKSDVPLERLKDKLWNEASTRLRSPAAPGQGSLVVAILNEDPAFGNRVVAHYDHNNQQDHVDYLAGHYVGARVCAEGGAVSGVTAELLESVGTPDVAFPAYDGNNDENEFELGRNESVIRDLGDLESGECALAYYYIFIPRHKYGPPVALGMTQTFAIEATGTAVASASDSSIIEMDDAQTAHANTLEGVSSVVSGGFMTLTVNFDLGNPGGNGEVSLNPTGWVTHDASIFDLVGISVTIPPIARTETDLLFLSGVFKVGGNAPVGWVKYIFKVVGSGTTEFFPKDVVNSGTQFKFNPDLGAESSGPISVAPELRINKECMPYYVEAGGKVTCTITYSNTGNLAAESVRLKDDYDEDNGGVSNISDGGAISLTDGTNSVISWTIGTVAIGARDTVSYVYTVDTGVAGGTVINNLVTAYSDGQNPLTDADEWEVVAPTISIVKKANGDDPEYILSNDTVVYNYYVTNGPASTVLTDVIVTDDKCVPVTKFSGDALLNPGETWEYRCTKAVTETTVNTGAVTAQPADASGVPLPGVGRVEDDDIATVNVLTPTIRVDKTASPIKIHSGQSVLYTYKLTANLGNTELDTVSITDTHSACSLAAPISGDTDGDGRLDTNETWTYTCLQGVTDDITNTAQAKGHGYRLPSDRGWTMHSDTATVDVIHPAIEVVKTADPTVILANEWVTYTYRVENTGDDTLTDIEISDDKCVTLTLVAGDPDMLTDTFEIGDVLTYTCSMTLANTTSNLATVTGTDSLNDPVIDTSAPPVQVKVFNPNFAITKTASADEVHVGDTVIYTYEVSNESASAVFTDVVATDDHCDPDDDNPSGDDGNGLLDPGETWVYTCTAVLGQDDKPERTNTFQVTAVVSDTGDPVSDQDQWTVSVFDPAITVAKSVDRTIIRSGDTVTYTYVVRNTGNVTLTLTADDISDDTCTPLTKISGDLDDSMEAGDVWTYRCVKTGMTGDTIINTVTVTGTDPLDKEVIATASKTVQVVTPTVEIAKTADPTVTLLAGGVNYYYYVTNSGDTVLDVDDVGDDKCTSPTYVSGDNNPANGLLNIGETWVYECGMVVMGDITNTAIVTATPSTSGGDPLPGFDPITDTITATVDVVAPGIEVLKIADPTKIHVGESVTYSYVVTNTGDTVLTDIQVDDRVGSLIVCSPDEPASKENGDSDNLFEPDEVWTYTCTKTLDDTTNNEVTVSGQPSDESGNPWSHIPRESDSDTASVVVIDPDVSIGKTPSADKVNPGDTVTYTYRVENTGDDPLAFDAGDVTDSACGPVTGPETDILTIGLLDPGEEWVFTCTKQLNMDTTNWVTVTVTDTLHTPISATSSAFVDVVIAGVDLEKTANKYTIHTGDLVTYTYTVSNTSTGPTDVLTDVEVTDDHCTPEFVSGDTDGDDELDKGELWIYECVTDTLDVTTKNTAQATAIVSDTGRTVSDTASVNVVVLHPAITVTKSANRTVVRSGGVVEYTYLVENPGDTPLSAVTVGDPHCNPGSRISGDINGDNKLDKNETWLYRCSTPVHDDITNTVTAEGRDSLARWVTAEASEFVDVVTPTIEIVKTANPVIIPPEGAIVQYTYVVRATGDVLPLSDVTVIDDPLCVPMSAPTGDTNHNSRLDPGEIWTYLCSMEVTEAITNTATASGQPWNPGGTAPVGTRITDQDTASVEMEKPPVVIPVGGVILLDAPVPARTASPLPSLALLAGLLLAGSAVVVARKHARRAVTVRVK
jgi:uncharacterized repeat protein (TIGR01451 family)